MRLSSQLRSIVLAFLIIVLIFNDLIGQGDATPPILSALSITPDTINVSLVDQNITFEATLTDDLSGIVGATVEFRNPGGGGSAAFLQLVSGSNLNGVYQATVNFNQNSANGTWEIFQFWSYDNEGNYKYIGKHELETGGFPTEFVIINSGQGDATPPILSALSITPDTINVSLVDQNITFEATLTDDLSGIVGATVEFRNPGGGGSAAFLQLVSGSNLNGVYQATVNFNQNSANGTWEIFQFWSYDNEGNYKYIGKHELETGGFPTEFVIINSGQGDATPPILSALSITPDTINVSLVDQNITFEATLTDDLSGIVGATVEFRNPGGGGSAAFLQLVSGSNLNGVYQATVNFDQNSANGTWEIFQFWSYDNRGNYKYIGKHELETRGFPTEFVIIHDSCPKDPKKVSPGQCGCGKPDKDSDCDGIADCNDLCPGGDDKVDNNHDGKPDCKYPPAYNAIIPKWKASNNRVYVCHYPIVLLNLCFGSFPFSIWPGYNIKTSYASLASHIKHGDYLGPCGNVNCCGLQPRESEYIESLSQSKMILFPNPSKNLLNIQLPSFTTLPIRVNVYNSLGQVQLSNLVNSYGNNLTVISLDIESIPGGYYFLSVSSEEYSEVKTFTKLE